MKKLSDKKTLYKILKHYYIDDLTQNEISKKLNISRIKVIRYLNYAKENGFVETKLNIPIKDSYELEDLIETTFALKECRIVPTFSSGNDIFKYAGFELTDILKRILKPNIFIGVSWSETFRNVLEYINIGRKFNVNVVPIIGGLELEGSSSNSNFIAHIFAEKIGGINYNINLPAVLDSKEARKIMENERNTKKIKELAEKIELVITGIGNIGPNSTALKGGYFKPDEINYLNSLGIVGSINLNFIDKNGKEVKSSIDDRIIKIFPLEKFKKTENVIGIAFGKDKVEAIKAALKGNIIKLLITDENTARALLLP